jgi:hypothetical protein
MRWNIRSLSVPVNYMIVSFSANVVHVLFSGKIVLFCNYIFDASIGAIANGGDGLPGPDLPGGD